MTTELAALLKTKQLTEREITIAHLTARGLSNRAMGEKIGVSEQTIKFHLTNVYKKMGLTSRAQLIVKLLPLMSFVDDTFEA